MDPKACWMLLVGAVECDDQETVRECIAALQHWKNKGGFCPPCIPAIVWESLNRPVHFIASQIAYGEAQETF